MIRTHKPRGHHWTNASAFQQTEGFRDIRLEDLVESGHGTANVDRTTNERTAKRRRIQMLADDFLNGQPLFVSSARLCPQALANTITWHKNSSGEPKYSFPAVKYVAESTEVWRDVEDEAERFRMIARSTFVALKQLQEVKIADIDLREVSFVHEEEAQASCGRARPRRVQHIGPDPSSSAFRQADAWRNRALLANLPRGTQSEPRPAGQIPKAMDGPHRPDLVEGDSRNVNVGSEEWLSRRASHLLTLGAGDESLDELRLSRTQTPSRQRRRSDQAAKLSSTLSRMVLLTDPNTSGEGDAGHGGDRGVVHETNTPVHDARPQDGSQGGLPRSQGTRITHAMWTPINPRCLTTATNSSGPQPIQSLPSTHPIRRSTRLSGKGGESVSMELVMLQQPALRPLSTKRRHLTDGPRLYTVEGKPKDGLTPFMFRKLRSGDHHGSKTGPRELDLQSSPVRKLLEDDSGKMSQHGRSASEPPTSIQNHDDASLCGGNIPSGQAFPQLWPGTQALMFQAQRDLFTSPEKQIDLNEAAEDKSPESIPARSPRPVREPLKQLSQEPMPSTQQLLANFEGFSTVKKPRSNYQVSPAPTPTAAPKGRPVGIGNTASVPPSVPADKTNRRSSGLRNSVISADSPASTTPHPMAQTDILSVTRTQRTTRSNAEWATPASESWRCSTRNRSSQVSPVASPAWTPDQASLQRTNSLRQQLSGVGSHTRLAASTPQSSSLRNSYQPPDGDTTLPSNPLEGQSSFDAALSSFQCGQRGLSLMSEGMLEKTIDEVTRDVLFVPDGEGVLSQV